MVQLIRKKEQVGATMFGGNFITNKPVAQGPKAASLPYSSLFYWSHARATGPVEFGLHPHKGFEIMSFVWEGENIHYDTSSQKWTPLAAGQFQVIQSGSGLQHAEKISTGTRSFQIWFDPNFAHSLQQTPSYSDYNPNNWSTVIEDGFTVRYYIGGNSPAKAATEGVTIKTYTTAQDHTQTISLDADTSYHLYVLNGKAQIGDALAETDDSIKIAGPSKVTISLKADTLLFIIQLPTQPSYETAFS